MMLRCCQRGENGADNSIEIVFFVDFQKGEKRDVEGQKFYFFKRHKKGGPWQKQLSFSEENGERKKKAKAGANRRLSAISMQAIGR